MITTKVQKNINVALNYFDDHLKPDEYYTEDMEQNSGGKWIGDLSKKFGICGDKVTKEQFQNLLFNKSPVEGEKLTQRTKEGRRLYFDAVLSAPKTVSILGLTMGDSRLVRAHEKAVDTAIKELEVFAQTRVRTKGQNTVRRSKNILAAQFMHQTSRALDPQLHTHNLIFNVTFDSIEDKYKALEAFSVYDNSNFLTQVYRNELAKEILNLGYSIEKTKYGIEISGVDKAVVDMYSKRSGDIKAKRKELEGILGRELTNNELSNISHQTRDSKDSSLSPSEVKELQINQLSSKQKNELSKLVSGAVKKDLRKADGQEKKSLDYALKKLLERKSTTKIYDVLNEALKFSPGLVSLEELKKELYSDKELLIDFDKETLSSVEQLKKEMNILEMADRSMGEAAPIMVEATRLEALDIQQNLNRKGILEGKDRINVLRGAAGAGKSHLISRLAKDIQNSGAELYALAPTGGAVSNLRDDLNVDASTIQSFLKLSDKDLKRFKDAYLIIDEAGMLSYDQMERVLDISERMNCRVLLSGDTRQNHSIQSGDALRIIEDYSETKVYELTEVRRQSNSKHIDNLEKSISNEELNFDEIEDSAKAAYKVERYKKFSTLLSKKDVEGAFVILEGEGFLKEVQERDERLTQISNEYVEGLQNGKETIVVTVTNKEKDQINTEIRRELLGKNLLDDSKNTIKSYYKDLSLTQVEKENLDKSVEISTDNLFLVPNTNYKGLEANKPYEYSLKKGNKIEIKEGRVSLDTKFFTDFSIQQKQEKEFCIGDKVTFKRKYIDAQGTQVPNGTTSEVTNISKDGVIQLSSGVEVSKSFGMLDHGYAMTTYSSQGKTCDKVIVSFDSSSSVANYSSFYVGTTRGREELSVYVEDSEKALMSAKKDHTREAAIELVSEIQQKLKEETISISEAIPAASIDKSTLKI